MTIKATNPSKLGDNRRKIMLLNQISYAILDLCIHEQRVAGSASTLIKVNIKYMEFCIFAYAMVIYAILSSMHALLKTKYNIISMLNLRFVS